MKMMNSSALLALLATCAAMVAADGVVKICTGVNLAGTCTNLAYVNNACVGFPLSMNDVVSSLDPMGCGHNCVLFRDYGCAGPSINFNMRYDDLGCGGFNDTASSFRCSS